MMVLWLVLGPFIEIKTGYQGFETKQNPIFHLLVTVHLKIFIGVHERKLVTGNFFHEMLLGM